MPDDFQELEDKYGLGEEEPVASGPIDTPRTNAHIQPQSHTYSPSVNQDFARMLERENNALRKERDDADRRAGAAERKCEDLQDTCNRRESWLSRAKKEWGVNFNTSFDVVWNEALELKGKLTLAESRNKELEGALMAACKDLKEMLVPMLGFYPSVKQIVEKYIQDYTTLAKGKEKTNSDEHKSAD